jgi:hypothetical protein
MPLMMILSAALAAAAAAAAWFRKQRILAQTRSLLALAPRLELAGPDGAAGSVKLAGPPIAIRARLDRVHGHG